MKIKLLLLLVLCMFTMGSCFEIIEEFNLQSDGSGSFKMTVNLSQSKTKLASIMLLDSINGSKVPDEKLILSKINQLEEVLGGYAGISEVKSNANFDDFIFTLSCNFQDVEALNTIANHIKSMDKKNLFATDTKPHITFDGATFKRSQNFNLSAINNRINGENREIIKGASLRTILRFENTIKSASNPASKISKNKKAIMTKVGISDLISNKASVENTITINK